MSEDPKPNKRVHFLSYNGYLLGEWRLLLKEVTVTISDVVAARSDFAYITIGRESADPLGVELVGLHAEPAYFELMFPGGGLDRRTIHTWNSFPRITGTDRNGHLVTAVAGPPPWGGDSSHIPVLRAELEELTVIADGGGVQSPEVEAVESLWFRGLKSLSAYKPTRKYTERQGKSEGAGWSSDWLTIDLGNARVNFEKRDQEITDLEVIASVPADPDLLGKMTSSLVKALSTLFMQRLNPLMSALSYSEWQSITLLKRRSKPRGSGRFVYTGAKEEIEWITRAYKFFFESPIAGRVWGACELVLDSRNQQRAVQVAIAIEHIAKNVWTGVLGRGQSSFKIAQKLPDVLKSLNQQFVQEELDAWRWYRDGSVHANDGFLDSMPILMDRSI